MIRGKWKRAIFKNSMEHLKYGGLKSSYDDIIFAIDVFLTNGIHRWKKCADWKGHCVEK